MKFWPRMTEYSPKRGLQNGDESDTEPSPVGANEESSGYVDSKS